MQCRDAHEVLNVLLDGETDADTREAARAHVASCPLCADTARDYRVLGDQLRAAARMPAPANLASKIAVRIAAEAGAANDNQRPDWHGLVRLAAALVLVAGLSALASWYLTQLTSETHRLERDVVAAHVRSLLQESPVQIASSETHAVRPWFNGRIEFAPAVKDLTADGFPLMGGRLDFIDERRVATLVYKRRLHVINVFIWPAGDRAATSAPSPDTLQGYNTLTWSTLGMIYWAVSDLNAKELAQLQSLL